MEFNNLTDQEKEQLLKDYENKPESLDASGQPPSTTPPSVDVPAVPVGPDALPEQPIAPVEPPKMDLQDLLNKFQALNNQTQSPYGKDLSDEAMQQAIKQRDEKLQVSNLLRAGNTIGSAIGGVKNDESFSDVLDKQANNPIANLLERRGAKDKELNRQNDLFKIQQEKDNMDPTSLDSQLARDAIRSMVPKANIPDTASAASLYKLLPILKQKVDSMKGFQQGGVDEVGNKLVFDPMSGSYRVSGAKAADQLFQVKDPNTGEVNLMGRRAGNNLDDSIKGVIGAPKASTGQEDSPREIFETLPPKQRDKLDKTRKDFLQDTKDDRDAINSAAGIKTMLAAGKELNGDVVRAIQNQLARASGEKGAMTEKDVSPFGGRADVISRLKRYATIETVGQLPDSDRKFLSSLADVMEKKANDYVNRQSQVYSDNFATDTGLKSSQARKVIGVDSTLSKAEKMQDMVKVRDKISGKIGMIPRSNLEKGKDRLEVIE